jgi:hypothetical protein
MLTFIWRQSRQNQDLDSSNCSPNNYARRAGGAMGTQNLILPTGTMKLGEREYDVRKWRRAQHQQIGDIRSIRNGRSYWFEM